MHLLKLNASSFTIHSRLSYLPHFKLHARSNSYHFRDDATSLTAAESSPQMTRVRDKYGLNDCFEHIMAVLTCTRVFGKSKNTLRRSASCCAIRSFKRSLVGGAHAQHAQNVSISTFSFASNPKEDHQGQKELVSTPSTNKADGVETCGHSIRRHFSAIRASFSVTCFS